MNLIAAYEAEYRLIEAWLDGVFPMACADAGLPLVSSAPPPDVGDVARDERWYAVRSADSVPALLQVYLNTNRCNVVILVPSDGAASFLGDRIAATTAGAVRLGWLFQAVDERRVICFFEGLDLAAASGVNSGWIARDLARMLRWLLSTGTTF